MLAAPSWSPCPQTAESVLSIAYERGINLFDTAEVYASGKYVIPCPATPPPPAGETPGVGALAAPPTLPPASLASPKLEGIQASGPPAHPQAEGTRRLGGGGWGPGLLLSLVSPGPRRPWATS